MGLKEALYYKKIRGNVKCELCPNFCNLSEGQTGICKVRKNINGKLISLNYGRIVAMNVDPIEKKPLYHFYPFSKIFSFGTAGCNLKCKFCQNFDISQEINPESAEYISPQDLVDEVIKSGCDMIAFTYNEPTIFFEYMLDVAKIVKKSKMSIKLVMVTNGYINPKPLKEILKYIDAFNVDLKAFSKEFYIKQTHSKFENVLETLKIIAKSKKWLEITNLMIPELNDDKKEVEEMIKFISSLNKEIPFHLSRFFPLYKMKEHYQTPSQVLDQARDIAKKYLDYVYVGNISSDINTYCPKCKRTVIDRVHRKISIKKGKCNFCDYKIAGVFD